MAQTYVQLPDDAANLGKKEDHFATSGTGNLREAVVVADPATDAAVAKVQNATPGASDYGLTVRDPSTAALAAQSVDGDTGGGTAATPLVGIALPASGGPVAGGTATNPINVALPAATVSTLTPPSNTGYSTSGKQDTGNASLASLDTKAPALGQALAAGSLPVVLPSAQITTLTPPAAITGFSTSAKQPALGTAGTPSTDVLSVQGVAGGTALPISVASIPSHAVTNAGTFAVQATVAAAATNIAKAEDSASADGDVGVPAMAIQKATPVDTAGTDGDYAMLQMSAGRLWAAANIDKVNGVTPLMGAGNTGTGSPRVTIATDQAVIPVGDNAGSITVDAPVGTPVFVTPTPSTSGGWTYSKKAALSNTNSQVKSGAGTLGGWYIYNPNSSVAYVQIYDTATGSITVGTTAAVLTLGIPAGGAANIELTLGIAFATAICVAATTAAGNATAPSTALDCTFWYK